jgi:thiamine biosynthesis protein ThiS
MTDAGSITVNGRSHPIGENDSLLDVLSALDLDPRVVVVELNRDIVRRPQLGETRVRPGDHIELVHFVGGG